MQRVRARARELGPHVVGTARAQLGRDVKGRARAVLVRGRAAHQPAADVELRPRGQVFAKEGKCRLLADAAGGGDPVQLWGAGDGPGDVGQVGVDRHGRITGLVDAPAGAGGQLCSQADDGCPLRLVVGRHDQRRDGDVVELRRRDRGVDGLAVRAGVLHRVASGRPGVGDGHDQADCAGLPVVASGHFRHTRAPVGGVIHHAAGHRAGHAGAGARAGLRHAQHLWIDLVAGSRQAPHGVEDVGAGLRSVRLHIGGGVQQKDDVQLVVGRAGQLLHGDLDLGLGGRHAIGGLEGDRVRAGRQAAGHRFGPVARR